MFGIKGGGGPDPLDPPLNPPLNININMANLCFNNVTRNNYFVSVLKNPLVLHITN